MEEKNDDSGRTGQGKERSENGEVQRRRPTLQFCWGHFSPQTPYAL